MVADGITPIGKTNFRNTNQVFGIKDNDLFTHCLILGKTGSGKSTLMFNMIASQIRRGCGVLLLDPHSELAMQVLEAVPDVRKNDIVYFNPKDPQNAVGFNPLYGIHHSYHHLVASGLISAFKKVWHESWGPRMEYILKYCILTLLNYPKATLLDVQPLLTDNTFRHEVLQYVIDSFVLNFWQQEFDKYPKAFLAEAISPILNKIGVFAASTPLRRTIGQQARGLRLQEVMDNKKILIANLSKGELGEDASKLLGCLLIASIQSAALHRARQEADKRVPFFAYIDEVANYATLSFLDILSEARKYRFGVTMATQYIGTLTPEIQTAVFGNIGTLIVFRVGAEDAIFLEPEFYPVFDREDLVNLPKYHCYLKLMIDGATSRPFSAVTLKDSNLFL